MCSGMGSDDNLARLPVFLAVSSELGDFDSRLSMNREGLHAFVNGKGQVDDASGHWLKNLQGFLPELMPSYII